MATFDVHSSPVIVIVCLISPLTLVALGPGLPVELSKHLNLVSQCGVVGRPTWTSAAL